ncbi:MAG: large-conductance mechanosensitive channel protein MscL [Solobacterium sp.]|jgi:large conductance mechanosensitive channel|nr:large-conductance mechanosensitive channel protein MscL [Solobacterium sp.]
MKKFVKEFKEFAMKGNVMDLAVGMMIGSAFSAIVTSLVNDILTPLISTIFGAEDFSGLKILLVDKGDPTLNTYLNYGSFIQSVINFLIVAFCIFLIVKAINKLHRKPEEAPVAPVKSDETKALEEIIVLLKKDQKTA